MCLTIDLCFCITADIIWIALPVDEGFQEVSIAHFGALEGGEEDESSPITLGFEGVVQVFFWSLFL